jgi:hypothetical protein
MDRVRAHNLARDSDQSTDFIHCQFADGTFAGKILEADVNLFALQLLANCLFFSALFGSQRASSFDQERVESKNVSGICRLHHFSPVELQLDGVTQHSAEFGDVRIADMDRVAFYFLQCQQLFLVDNLTVLVGESKHSE